MIEKLKSLLSDIRTEQDKENFKGENLGQKKFPPNTDPQNCIESLNLILAAKNFFPH